MKKLLLILLCLPMIGFGQVTAPSVVSSSGDSYSNGGVIMDNDTLRVSFRVISANSYGVEDDMNCFYFFDRDGNTFWDKSYVY